MNSSKVTYLEPEMDENGVIVTVPVDPGFPDGDRVMEQVLMTGTILHWGLRTIVEDEQVFTDTVAIIHEQSTDLIKTKLPEELKIAGHGI